MENDNSNNKMKILAISIIVLVIAICLLLIYILTSNPTSYFKTATGMASKKVAGIVQDGADLTNKKVELAVSPQITLSNANESMWDNVVTELNSSKVTVTAQMDENLTTQINFETEGTKKLSGIIIFNLNDKKIYFNFPDVYNNYLYLELPDLDDKTVEDIKAVLENVKSKNSETIAKAISTEISNQIESKYCTSSSEKIDYNGKKTSTTKFTLKISEKDLLPKYKTIVENLANNSEFINSFDNQYRANLKDSLTSLGKSIEEEEQDLDGDGKTYTFTINAKGLLKSNVLRVGFNVSEDDKNEQTLITIGKNNSYSYEFTNSEDESANTSGTFAIKTDNSGKKTITTELKSSEVTSNFTIDYTKTDGASINNVGNAKDISDLTEEDTEKIYKNVEDNTDLPTMPLMLLLGGSFSSDSGFSTSSSSGDFSEDAENESSEKENTEKSNSKNENSENNEDEENYTFEDEPAEEEFNNTIDPNNTTFEDEPAQNATETFEDEKETKNNKKSNASENELVIVLDN